MHFKECVGFAMREHMDIDKMMDTYTITEILKKHLSKVFLARSIHGGIDDECEVLRNCIGHTGYTRNALMHSPKPSVFEMSSCIRAIMFLVESFPAESILSVGEVCDHYKSISARLPELVMACQQVMSYRSGECGVQELSQSNVALGLFVKYFIYFERELNAALELCKLPEQKVRDAKEIVEMLLNKPNNKQCKSCCMQKDLGAKALTAEQVDEIENHMKTIKKPFIVVAYEKGFVDLGTMMKIRSKAGEVRHPQLMKLWPRYKQLVDLASAGECLELILSCRNMLSHREQESGGPSVSLSSFLHLLDKSMELLEALEIPISWCQELHSTATGIIAGNTASSKVSVSVVGTSIEIKYYLVFSSHVHIE